jgi:hypothetical protein
MINDITGWIVFDECPDTPLDAIFPLSRRAACLVARNQDKTTNLNTNFLNIQGAVEMMLGLDYHHDNFINVVKRLTEAELTDESRGLKAQLVHEVVAYLNRMGQFHYFMISPFVRKQCPDAKTLAPTIEKFLPLRLKHSAHRSIDAPKDDDSQHMQETQAMSMSAFGPKIFEPKPGQSHNILDAKSEAERIAFFQDNWKKCFWICQFLTDNPKDVLNFSLEREHPKIMSEALLILEKVLPARQ